MGPRVLTGGGGRNRRAADLILPVNGLRDRDREWAKVVALVERARSGRGGMLLIEGPQGSGKTAILASAAEFALSAGFQHLSGCGDEMAQLIPLGALLPMLGNAVDTLRHAPGQSLDARLWLLEEVRAVLEQRAGEGQVLVTVDDVQWADPTTLFALRALPPQLDSHPLAWIIARRSGDVVERPEDFHPPLASGLITKMTLGPLPDASVVDLIADVLGAAPEPELVSLAADAGGNPLLITELVAGLRDEGALEIRGRRAALIHRGLPQRVHAVVRLRLLRLEPSTRDLLGVAAVLGKSFFVDDVAELLGEPPSRLLSALDEALAAGVLDSGPETLSFRQGLVWQVVKQTIPDTMRTALHRQAGDMLLARGGTATEAARHLLVGAQSGDRRALAGLDRAARETLRTSPQVAVDLALRALELTAPTDPGRFQRAVNAVDALIAARRLLQAAELARASLRGDPHTAAGAKLRCSLCWILIHDGRPDEAVKEADEVLIDTDLPPEILAAAEAERLVAWMTIGDLDQVRLMAEHLVSEGTSDSSTLAAARAGLAQMAWEEARLADAVAHIREAVRCADAGTATGNRPRPRVTLSIMLQALGRLDEAETVAQEAQAEIVRLGDTVNAAIPSLLGARIHLATGRLDDALLEAQNSQTIAGELGTRLYIPDALGVLAAIELRRGNLNAVEKLVDRLRQERVHGVVVGDARRLLWLDAQLAAARGDRPRAVRLLDAVYQRPRAYVWLMVQHPAAAAWLTRLALADGRRDKAEAVVAEAERIAAANEGFPTVVASAAHARGLLDRDLGALRIAASEQPDMWAASSAAEDLGALEGAGSGNRDGAIKSLEHAVTAYERMGAVRDIARTRRRLRRLGVHRRHWKRADRPVMGWDSLTDTERAVVELVSQGLTDRQVATQMFLSAHTINSHLRSVFRKLSINSRVELAVIVAGRQATTDRNGPEGAN